MEDYLLANGWEIVAAFSSAAFIHGNKTYKLIGDKEIYISQTSFESEQNLREKGQWEVYAKRGQAYGHFRIVEEMIFATYINPLPVQVKQLWEKVENLYYAKVTAAEV